MDVHLSVCLSVCLLLMADGMGYDVMSFCHSKKK